MPTILEPIELTDTTTSFAITYDHIDVAETLEQRFEKDRESVQQQADSNEIAMAYSNTSTPSVEK